jgi:transporter family protein
MSNLYLIVITIIGWGVGALFYKVANDNIHPIMVSTIVTIMYMVLTPLPFLLLKVDTHINSTGIIFSLLGGLIMSIGSIAYFYALKNGGAGEITTITALYPALTLALSVIFLHEDLSFKKIIGISLALLSVLVLSIK